MKGVYLETDSLGKRGYKLRYIDDRIVGIVDLIYVLLRIVYMLYECLEQMHDAAKMYQVGEG